MFSSLTGSHLWRLITPVLLLAITALLAANLWASTVLAGGDDGGPPGPYNEHYLCANPSGQVQYTTVHPPAPSPCKLGDTTLIVTLRHNQLQP